MAMGNHLRRHRWSWGTIYGSHTWPGGPSMIAILGTGTIYGSHTWPGGPPTATYFAADGPGDLFWGTICGMIEHVIDVHMVQITHNLNGPRVTRVCKCKKHTWHQTTCVHACKLNGYTYTRIIAICRETIILTTSGA